MRRLRFVPSACLAGILAFGLIVAAAGAAQDEGGAKVAWLRIVGIVQPEGIVGRPPGGASCEVGVECVGGTIAPWTVANGSAEVNLHNGDVTFTVSGLVLAGDPSFTTIGTPGVVTMVKGTFVCNDTAPGAPELVDTDAVALNARGDARFHGRVDLPDSCADEPEDIAFLIRIADVSDPAGAGLIDLWNAFGATRVAR